MKEFLCYYCREQWYVSNEKIDGVKVCPFCSRNIYTPKQVVVCSFETAICKVLIETSMEILKERNRFLAYLMDIGVDYRKEIHILSKACNDSDFVRIYNILKLLVDDTKNEFIKFERYLVDDEGVSESWAKFICDSFFKAICIYEECYNSVTSVVSVCDDEVTTFSTQTILPDELRIKSSTKDIESNDRFATNEEMDYLLRLGNDEIEVELLGEHLSKFEKVENMDLMLQVRCSCSEAIDFVNNLPVEFRKNIIGTSDSKFTKKVKNAIKSYASGIKETEVIALYDNTLLGNGKEGFIMTTDKIIIKTFAVLSVYKYSEVKEIKILYDEKWKLTTINFQTEKGLTMISGTMNGCECKNMANGINEIVKYLYNLNENPYHIEIK